jgi:hypothetical protein
VVDTSEVGEVKRFLIHSTRQIDAPVGKHMLQTHKAHLIASFQRQFVLLLERIFFCPFGADFFFGFGEVECWWKRRHGEILLETFGDLLALALVCMLLPACAADVPLRS